MFMSKSKQISISIAAILVVALATVAVLWALSGTNIVPDNQPKLTLTKDSDEEVNIADTSTDYGACDAVSVQAIKETLGTPAKDTQSEHNLGVAGDVGGTSQTCFYPFDAKLSLDNGLAVEVTRVDEMIDLDQEIELIAESNQLVDDLGDAAFYYFTDDEDVASSVEYINFSLVVYANDQRISFSIHQPIDSVDYSSEQAVDYLVSLVKQSSILE